VEAIAAALSEPTDCIEDMIEPFLLAQDFILRRQRGRLVTARTFEHLGLALPNSGRNAEQSNSAPSASAHRVLH